MCFQAIGLRAQNLLSLSKRDQIVGFDPSLIKLFSPLWCEAYFERWVKLLRPPLSTSQNLERISRPKIGYVHGTHCPKSWIDLCKAPRLYHFHRGCLSLVFRVVNINFPQEHE